MISSRSIHALCVFVICFFLSCGIENYIFFYPPSKPLHDPSSLDDRSKLYCHFNTPNVKNRSSSAAAYYKGCKIYYRIYEKKSDCKSAIDVIKKYNEKNPSSSAHYLVESKKYHFLTIKANSTTDRQQVLIEQSVHDQEVLFRLQKYDTDTPSLKVDGVIQGVLCRTSSLGDNTREYFTYANIKEDVDTEKASTSSDASGDKAYYINFYAVAYGYDTSYKSVFSELTHLGFIKLFENE